MDSNDGRPATGTQGMAKKIGFNSSALPAGLDDRARFALWHEKYSSTFLRASDASRLIDRPFSANWEHLDLGGAFVGRFEGTLGRVARNVNKVAADQLESFSISFNTGSRGMVMNQLGRQTAGGQSSAAFFSMAEASDVRGEHGVSWMAVSVPRKELLRRVPDAEDLLLRPLDPDSLALRHLRAYLAFLLSAGALDDAALLQPVSALLLDLMALSLGAGREATEIAQMRGLPAARLQSILGELKTGFSDPAFSAHRVASRLGLSSNYIQKLLHETGSSFTERVLELRLQKARARLQDPHDDAVKVSEIAYSCGFNEVSYFNRCFRRRFGASPTQYRGAA